MKLGHFFLLSLIISLSAFPAQAQSQTGGMRSKTLYVDPDRESPSVPLTAKQADKNEKDKDALARALQKYENLEHEGTEQAEQAKEAAQKTTKRPGSALPEGPKRVSMPKPAVHNDDSSTPPKEKRLSGFEKIINDYQESKKTRSKIRSRTITEE